MTGSVKIVWCLSFAIMSFAARAEHDMDEYRAMNELVQRCIDGEAAGLESLKSNVVAKAGPFIERMKTAGLADDEAGFLSDFEADCESGNPARMDYPLFVARAVILAELAKGRNVRGCEDFVAAVEDGFGIIYTMFLREGGNGVGHKMANARERRAQGVIVAHTPHISICSLVKIRNLAILQDEFR